MHGKRVGKVATQLFTQMEAGRKRDDGVDQGRLLRKLNCHATLYDIGSHIAHSDYHKHGAYILDNADAMGFKLSEMHRFSLLLLGHRGKLRKVENALDDGELVEHLMALRLAVILFHSRRDPDLTGMTLQRPEAATSVLQLRCRLGWAAA